MAKKVKSKKVKGKKAAAASGVPVHCSHQKMVAIGRLKPNPENPNSHPAAQVAKLAAIIKAHGWRHPITVSNRSGFIVSGHCRLLAAEKLRLAKCPVDYQHFKSKAEERAVLIADNVIAELAETDYGKMSDILDELEEENYPLELTGLDQKDLNENLVSADNEVAGFDYQEQIIKPYKKTHVLLSFSPELFLKIQSLLEKIRDIEGIEYEQASN